MILSVFAFNVVDIVIDIMSSLYICAGVVDVVVFVIVVFLDANFAILRCKWYFHLSLNVIPALLLTQICIPPFSTVLSYVAQRCGSLAVC